MSVSLSLTHANSVSVLGNTVRWGAEEDDLQAQLSIDQLCIDAVST